MKERLRVSRWLSRPNRAMASSRHRVAASNVFRIRKIDPNRKIRTHLVWQKCGKYKLSIASQLILYIYRETIICCEQYFVNKYEYIPFSRELLRSMFFEKKEIYFCRKKRFQFYSLSLLYITFLSREKKLFFHNTSRDKSKQIEGKANEARAHVLPRLLDRTNTFNRGLSHTRYGRLMNGICTRSHVTEWVSGLSRPAGLSCPVAFFA